MNYNTFDEWLNNENGKKRSKGFFADQLDLRGIRLSKTEKRSKPIKDLINLLLQHPA